MQNDDASNNGDIKWNLAKKETRETAMAVHKAKTEIVKHWDRFKKRVKNSVGVTPEILEAMLVDFQKATHQVILKQVPAGQMDEFRGFTDTLVSEARTKLGLLDKPPEKVAEDALSRGNTFTERHPDGSEGTTWGFEGRDALMAIPCVQNANAPDLVGFAMHGAMLLAIYEGKERPPFQVLGIVKRPKEVALPRLKDLAKRFKRRGLKFPELKDIPQV